MTKQKCFATDLRSCDTTYDFHLDKSPLISSMNLQDNFEAEVLVHSFDIFGLCLHIFGSSGQVRTPLQN